MMLAKVLLHCTVEGGVVRPSNHEFVAGLLSAVPSVYFPICADNDLLEKLNISPHRDDELIKMPLLRKIQVIGPGRYQCGTPCQATLVG
jgi:hypothetical protein